MTAFHSILSISFFTTAMCHRNEYLIENRVLTHTTGYAEKVKSEIKDTEANIGYARTMKHVFVYA